MRRTKEMKGCSWKVEPAHTHTPVLSGKAAVVHPIMDATNTVGVEDEPLMAGLFFTTPESSFVMVHSMITLWKLYCSF
jgi:hypothetical protein